jgi:precorrin-2 dehydrogenase/sirohydrochlorin ferrochelatase
MLDVAGRDVLIVGGGMVAARRAAALLDAGASVRIVSPALAPELNARQASGEVSWQARGYRAGDCEGAYLVVVASDDPTVNEQAVREARTAGALVNDAENPGRGDLGIPAMLRRGRIEVAVSSGGAGPGLAAFVRDRLAEHLGPELARLAELAARMRERDRAAGVGAAARQETLAVALPRLLALLEAGQDGAAEQLADELSGAQRQAEAPAWS